MITQSIEAVDLVSMIERDLGPGRRYGRWVIFRCPFHDDKHPSLAVTNGDDRGPFWRCFAAACGKQGGPVKWLMEYNQMSYLDATIELTRGAYSGSGGRADEVSYEFEFPPGQAWQGRALDLIKWAEGNLWSDPGASQLIEWPEVDPGSGEVTTRQLSALDWLLGRGLSAETLKFWRVGYIPADGSKPFWNDSPERWGLTGKRVFIPQGILIPCFIGPDVWYLKIRRPGPKGQKYIHIRGGQRALYMAQTLEWQDTVVFCEGELDALLLWQEVGDLAGVVTLGSADNPFNVATWGVYLLYTTKRFVAYDSDAAGQEGAKKLDWLNPRQLTAPKIKPGDKDLTDYYKGGGDLRELVKARLPEYQKACSICPQEGLQGVF